MSNIARVRITVKGTRPFLQHWFGPDAIPLEGREKTGVAGNDPEEYKRTCMVTPEGQLFFYGTYCFGTIRDGARHAKKGVMSKVQATLQIEDDLVLLDRFMPRGEPKPNAFNDDVYIDVRMVRNPTTKARNIRYRLATRPGWTCSFTIYFDRTVVPREVMKSIVIDAGKLEGFASGRKIGMGRFDLLKWEELDAQEETAPGTVESTPVNRVAKGRGKVSALSNGSDA